MYIKYFINLVLERGEGREKEGERNIDVREKHWLVASRMCPDRGPNLQCRDVHRPGIEFTILQAAGWRSNQESHTGQGTSEKIFNNIFLLSFSEKRAKLSKPNKLNHRISQQFLLSCLKDFASFIFSFLKGWIQKSLLLWFKNYTCIY